MVFIETKLKGAYIVDLDLIEDHRGFFARSFCKREFENMGLASEYVQQNISYNKKKGTLRGLHYQKAPYEEVKLVRCIKGAIFDVIADIREDSPTYLQWIGVELSEENRKMIYVPKGFAHGFQTLTDDSEAMYMMSEFYHGDHGETILYSDSKIGIRWPISDSIITNDKDKSALGVSDRRESHDE